MVLLQEFEKLNCQLIAASTDTEETHLAWIRWAAVGRLVVRGTWTRGYPRPRTADVRRGYRTQPNPCVCTALAPLRRPHPAPPHYSSATAGGGVPPPNNAGLVVAAMPYCGTAHPWPAPAPAPWPPRRTPRNRGGLGYMQIPILADTTKVRSCGVGW